MVNTSLCPLVNCQLNGSMWSSFYAITTKWPTLIWVRWTRRGGILYYHQYSRHNIFLKRTQTCGTSGNIEWPTCFMSLIAVQIHRRLFFPPMKIDYLISVAFCGLKNVDCGCYDVIRVCHYFKFCKFILIWVHHRKQRRLSSKDFNKTYNIDVIYWRSTCAGIMTPIHLWLSSNT